MADKNKQPIIIRRVQGGGGHGHHGGAWKVAFADFMTAMMCFFLVMWLMGTDEEIKASIADYFNNPTTMKVFRPEISDKKAVPFGNNTGTGEQILNGAKGKWPDNLVQR